MPKRAHSELTTTAAAESPKKRGRPSKKLEPQGSPPVKRKGGWPKGKPRKPQSPSPEVSKEPKSKEAGVAPGETDPWVLVNTHGGDFWPRSLNQDKRVISLIRKYLANSFACDKFWSKGVPSPEELVEMNRLYDIHYDLAEKLEEIGVFESKHCNREKWKLKRLSKLTAEEREKIDCGLMSEESRAEHQRSQGRVYRGKYSLP
tara:strand:+ start:7177 stop:7785 length:609 start_codon:yes stop_codon:yes gene_type:complete